MDPHDAHAAAVRHNNALVRGTYEEDYAAGKADGIKEGMRMAAEIADQYASVEGIAQRIRDAILKEIGE